jgi:hypothetical protein
MRRAEPLMSQVEQAIELRAFCPALPANSMRGGGPMSIEVEVSAEAKGGAMEADTVRGGDLGC